MLVAGVLWTPLVESPNGVDRVCGTDVFVGAVALDTGEAKRQSPGVMWTCLNSIEGYFDHEFWLDVDRVRVATDLARL